MVERTRRVRLWVFAVVGLLVFGLGFGWVLAHRNSSPTPPLWTAAELAPAVDTTDNGWRVIQRRASPFDRLDDERIRDLLDAEQEQEQEQEQAARLLALYDAARAPLQTIARERAADIDEVFQALGKPRYADECTPDIVGGFSCTPLVLLPAADLAIVGVLDLASRGDFPGAFGSARVLLHAHVDLARSAHQLTVSAVAFRILSRVLTLLEIVMALADRAGIDPATCADSRAALHDSLVELREDRAMGSRIVIADYLSFRSYLMAAHQANDPWLIDWRATSAMKDERYRALHAYAMGETSTHPVFEDPTESPFFHLYNREGRTLVALTGDGDDVLHVLDIRTALLTRAAALEEKLAAR